MTNIQELIDKSLERKGHKGSGKISPSQLGRCYRFQYWSRKGEEHSNPLDKLTLRKFKCGDLFHEFVQDFLPKHQTEVLIETEDIKGYADIVLEDEVIDIKSQHSRAFWYMQKSNYDINTKRYPNILQLMTYCYLLKKPKGRLIFVSKDDLTIAEYGFYLSKWQKEVENELNHIRFFWKGKKLPPADPRAYLNDKGEPQECKYCPYKDKCNQEVNK
jgi:CRISPR/Cas system-associated exonuclease Cas4 (RecB family)